MFCCVQNHNTRENSYKKISYYFHVFVEYISLLPSTCNLHDQIRIFCTYEKYNSLDSTAYSSIVFCRNPYHYLNCIFNCYLVPAFNPDRRDHCMEINISSSEGDLNTDSGSPYTVRTTHCRIDVFSVSARMPLLLDR